MSAAPTDQRTIQWRVNLRSSPQEVFTLLNTHDGRRRFWAESAEEVSPGRIQFRFSGGETWNAVILERTEPLRFAVTYFQGSVASFQLTPDGKGGTDLLLSESGVSPENWHENQAGWVSVLLSLKAAVDHEIDLRNHDPLRTWARGYVDV